MFYWKSSTIAVSPLQQYQGILVSQAGHLYVHDANKQQPLELELEKVAGEALSASYDDLSSWLWILSEKKHR